MSISPRPIRFFFRGQIQAVRGLPATMSVLRWLREEAQATGTKEGCAEGDCGACTVLLGELDAAGRLQLRHLNACIQFIPMLDGKALFTVEDIGSAREPGPVQRALIDCHGSQCGFCTPGFAMTLQALYEEHQAAGSRPSRQALADGLSGNLCRCTGYRPILDAGERMFEAPLQLLDRAPAEAALRQLREDAALHYASHDPATGREQHFHQPRSLEALAALREALPEARLLAGATDVGLWVNKQFRDIGDVISTLGVPALREIRAEALPDGRPGLWLGAAASLEDAWATLVAQQPSLRELWMRFASPPVRNAGTLGGNIANGSPIGDGAPALIALDAEIVLRRGSTQRRLLLQDFYLDYMKNALQPGEFVEALHVPQPAPGTQVRAYKIAKRYDSDISAVCAVFALRLESGRLASVRAVYGGMAGIVKRAAAVEAAMLGQDWTEQTATAAAQALPQDFQPLSDLRASSGYRLQVAQNLIRRCWLETRAEAPLPAARASVWWATQLNGSAT